MRAVAVGRDGGCGFHRRLLADEDGACGFFKGAWQGVMVSFCLLYREAFGVGLAVYVCRVVLYSPNQLCSLSFSVFSRVGNIKTGALLFAGGAILGSGISHETMLVCRIPSTADEIQ